MAGQVLLVDPSNEAQARAWDGDEGAYWATHADRFERAVQRYDGELLTAAGIERASRVLDVGCGTGSTSRAAARLAPEGRVVGVDLSSQMLAAARQRAAAQQLSNVEFVQADAQVHCFPDAGFDVVLSRTGAMFFADQQAAFRNLARATAPGGRLALLVWQQPARNEWVQVVFGSLATDGRPPAPPPGAPSPFALADPAHTRRVLDAAGFRDVQVTGVEQPMLFGADADDATRFLVGLTGWLLAGRDERDQEQAVDRLRAQLSAHETADGVLLRSAAWVVTARA